MVKRPQIAGKDFDRELLMRKGADRYRADKIKAATIGGSMTKGSSRPWARKNMVLAMLHRHQMQGKTFTATALVSYSKFEAGKHYKLEVLDTRETGMVILGGLPMTAQEAAENFKIHKNAS